MKTGSILQSPIEALEVALARANDRVKAAEIDAICATANSDRFEKQAEGLRYAIKMLKEKSNEI